jgi:elongation factor G
VLELFTELTVTAPDQYSGEIVGEISAKRGKILGMEADVRMQVVKAELPQAALQTFHHALTRLTQGRARYSYRFSHYEEAPAEVVQQLAAEKNA